MGTTIQEHLKAQVAALPHNPGVYKFLDASGKVIYVGKAKSLKRRVSSYFVESRNHSAKVVVMVRQIADIQHFVVDSEQDALLLENSLIKSLQPRYNILLKDDKSYPWIVIRNEHFPRVESTRQLVRDGSEYFGPYGSLATQRVILEFIHSMLPLRTCKLRLTPSTIESGKYNVCLQHHLGNCSAPCVGKISAEEYNEHIALVRSILKGNLRPVKEWLTNKMWKASDAWEFKEAELYKQRLARLSEYQARSVIVSSKIEDVDTFALLIEDDEAYCTYLGIRNGSIVAIQTIRLGVGIETNEAEILATAIQHFVENITGGLTREVIASTMPAASELFDGTIFTIPKRGEKATLIEFALRSARLYRAERARNAAIANPSRHTDRVMEAMRQELHLAHEPRYIECFDNSNLQGTNPVASCVVFRNGKPSRKEYRHYNVKSVEGPDDFASMREIVHRRYSRLIAEGAELPDLIIVDGGKGQLSSAYGVLCDLGIAAKVPIVGLAKRIEEIFFPDDPMPYYLRRTGEPLKVVCHIRDEAHRFAITFHRQKRSQSFLNSELNNIKGVGEKSITALLRHFKSINAIRNADLQALAAVVGEQRALKIKEHFDTTDKKS